MSKITHLCKILQKTEHRVREDWKKWRREADYEFTVWNEIPDTRPGRDPEDFVLIGAFPVFSGDTVSSIFKKWYEVFKQEANDFLQQLVVEEQVMASGLGMSSAKTMRIGARIPETLYKTLEQKWPEIRQNDKDRKSVV